MFRSSHGLLVTHSIQMAQLFKKSGWNTKLYLYSLSQLLFSSRFTSKLWCNVWYVMLYVLDIANGMRGRKLKTVAFNFINWATPDVKYTFILFEHFALLCSFRYVHMPCCHVHIINWNGLTNVPRISIDESWISWSNESKKNALTIEWN